MAGEHSGTSSRFSFWGMVGLLLILFFLLNYLDRVNDLLVVDNKITAMQQEIQTARQWNLQLQDEFNYYASPEYVEEMARAELGYVQPGDNVLVVLEAEPISSDVDTLVMAETGNTISRANGPLLFSAEWWQWLFSPAQPSAVAE